MIGRTNKRSCLRSAIFGNRLMLDSNGRGSKSPRTSQIKLKNNISKNKQSVQRGLHWWYDQITKKISSGYTMLHICFTSHKTHAVKKIKHALLFSGNLELPNSHCTSCLYNHLVPLAYQITSRCLPQCSDKTMCPDDFWQLNWLVKDHMFGWSWLVKQFLNLTQTVCLAICLSIHVCLSIHPSMHTSIHLYICISIYPSVYVLYVMIYHSYGESQF